jgi:hypothetical protein
MVFEMTLVDVFGDLGFQYIQFPSEGDEVSREMGVVQAFTQFSVVGFDFDLLSGQLECHLFLE